MTQPGDAGTYTLGMPGSGGHAVSSSPRIVSMDSPACDPNVPSPSVDVGLSGLEMNRSTIHANWSEHSSTTGELSHWIASTRPRNISFQSPDTGATPCAVTAVKIR